MNFIFLTGNFYEFRILFFQFILTRFEKVNKGRSKLFYLINPSCLQTRTLIWQIVPQLAWIEMTKSLFLSVRVDKLWILGTFLRSIAFLSLICRFEWYYTFHCLSNELRFSLIMHFMSDQSFIFDPRYYLCEK